MWLGCKDHLFKNPTICFHLYYSNMNNKVQTIDWCPPLLVSCEYHIQNLSLVKGHCWCFISIILGQDVLIFKNSLSNISDLVNDLHGSITLEWSSDCCEVDVVWKEKKQSCKYKNNLWRQHSEFESLQTILFTKLTHNDQHGQDQRPNINDLSLSSVGRSSVSLLNRSILICRLVVRWLWSSITACNQHIRFQDRSYRFEGNCPFLIFKSNHRNRPVITSNTSWCCQSKRWGDEEKIWEHVDWWVSRIWLNGWRHSGVKNIKCRLQ